MSRLRSGIGAPGRDDLLWEMNNAPEEAVKDNPDLAPYFARVRGEGKREESRGQFRGVLTQTVDAVEGGGSAHV